MIAIKGLRQGLLIVFDNTGNTPWLSQLYELQRKIESSSNFFKGGRIAFDVKDFTLSVEEIDRAKTMLAEHEVTLWAILSTRELTAARAREAGLTSTLSETQPLVVKAPPTPPPTAEPASAQPPGPPSGSEPPAVDGSGPHEPATTAAAEALAMAAIEAPVAPTATSVSTAEPTHIAESGEHESTEIVEGTDGLLVRKRVRSGQVLRHPGHIVVIGDVNPGAALIAGGDIIVWGRLYGSAHAGALGDEKAVVCALDLDPSLLRIADATRVARNEKRRQPKPETALLEEQQILLIPWTAGR